MCIFIVVKLVKSPINDTNLYHLIQNTNKAISIFSVSFDTDLYHLIQNTNSPISILYQMIQNID